MRNRSRKDRVGISGEALIEVVGASGVILVLVRAMILTAALIFTLMLSDSVTVVAPRGAAFGAGGSGHVAPARVATRYRAAVRFRAPGSIATDRRGNLYVAAGCCTIEKLSPHGRVLARWRVGSSANPISIAALAVAPQGTIYGTDALGFRIVRLSASGQALPPWGRYGSGPGRFENPEGIAVDTAGNVYAGDCGRIQKLSPSGKPAATWKLTGARNCAFGVAVDRRGSVYAATGIAVEKFLPSGKVQAVWGRGGAGSVRFLESRWLAVDGRGNVYVSDTTSIRQSHLFERVRKLSPAGKVLTTWQLPRDRSVAGIATDVEGDLYLEEFTNRGGVFKSHPAITKLSPAGKVLAVWA